MHNTETVSVGIQNKNTLKSLFLSRPAAKNNAKIKINNPEQRRKEALGESIRDGSQSSCLLLPNAPKSRPGTWETLREEYRR
jgi:hypothetical protein